MPQAEIDGLSINYDVQGQGEPLVLIPYLAADHACYAFQLPAYTEHFSCISVDLPGSGESDKPPGPYSTEHLRRSALRIPPRDRRSNAPTSPASRWAPRSRCTWRHGIPNGSARSRSTAPGIEPMPTCARSWSCGGRSPTRCPRSPTPSFRGSSRCASRPRCTSSDPITRRRSPTSSAAVPPSRWRRSCRRPRRCWRMTPVRRSARSMRRRW